jgi:hypothetical protein
MFESEAPVFEDVGNSETRLVWMLMHALRVGTTMARGRPRTKAIGKRSCGESEDGG